MNGEERNTAVRVQAEEEKMSSSRVVVLSVRFRTFFGLLSLPKTSTNSYTLTHKVQSSIQGEAFLGEGTQKNGNSFNMGSVLGQEKTTKNTRDGEKSISVKRSDA